MEVLAARLKWLREQKRLAQKEIASNIGVTLSGYQKMEYNESNPKIETLVHMAKYFKVSTDFLLGLVDETELTLKYLSELRELKLKIEKHRHSQLTVREKLYEVEKDVAELENMLSNNQPIPERDLNLRVRKMEELKDMLRFHDHNYYELLTIMEKVIMDYFMQFYSIPYSKPEENEIIKEYLPLDVALEEYGDRNYKIKLKSLNGTNLGLLYMKQSDDKEGNYKDALDYVNKYKELFRLN